MNYSFINRNTLTRFQFSETKFINYISKLTVAVLGISLGGASPSVSGEESFDEISSIPVVALRDTGFSSFFKDISTLLVGNEIPYEQEPIQGDSSLKSYKALQLSYEYLLYGYDEALENKAYADQSPTSPFIKLSSAGSRGSLNVVKGFYSTSEELDNEKERLARLVERLERENNILTEVSNEYVLFLGEVSGWGMQQLFTYMGLHSKISQIQAKIKDRVNEKYPFKEEGPTASNGKDPRVEQVRQKIFDKIKKIPIDWSDDNNHEYPSFGYVIMHNKRWSNVMEDLLEQVEVNTRMKLMTNQTLVEVWRDHFDTFHTSSIAEYNKLYRQYDKLLKQNINLLQDLFLPYDVRNQSYYRTRIPRGWKFFISEAYCEAPISVEIPVEASVEVN